MPYYEIDECDAYEAHRARCEAEDEMLIDTAERDLLRGDADSFAVGEAKRCGFLIEVVL